MAENDPYADPKTGVLYNRLRITEPQKLGEAEAAFTAVRTMQLKTEPHVGNFDLPHLQSLHKHIFGDVYGWAGELRTVSITKGNSMFARPEYIESEAKKLFAALGREDHLKGLSRNQFADRAAHYLTEINALHPFREGNGRAQQAFMEQLGREAGHALDFSRIDRETWNKAASDSMHKGHEHLKPMIERAMDDARQRGHDHQR